MGFRTYAIRTKASPGDTVRDAFGNKYTVKSVGLRYYHVLNSEGSEVLLRVTDVMQDLGGEEEQ